MDLSVLDLKIPPGSVDSWAMFLDVDGTLIEIAPTPDAVVVPAELVPTLAALRQTLRGALAVVSGRSLGQIDALLAPLQISAAGHHGAEVRLENHRALLRSPPKVNLTSTIDRLQAFASSRPGVLIEDKGFTAAAHYRLAPSYEPEVRAEIVSIQQELGPDWQVLTGKMVYELKPVGFDKGGGVRELMKHPPFTGRTPLFIGDDVTDEYGFAAAVALGGHGIRIGREPAGEARWTLPDPATLRSWLAAIAGDVAGKRTSGA